MSGQTLVVVCSLAFVCAAWANPTIEAAEKEISEGNPKRAYAILVAKQKSMAGNPEFDYLFGVAARDTGRIDEAITALHRVVAVDPQNEYATHALGVAYFKLVQSAKKEILAGNSNRAYTKLVARESNRAGDPEFDYWLGRAAFAIGKTNEAITAFQRAVASNPIYYPGASLELALAYFKIGKFDEAESILKELRNRNPPEKASIEIESHLQKIEAKRKSSPLK